MEAMWFIHDMKRRGRQRCITQQREIDPKKILQLKTLPFKRN
jgi:hypothetical protein